MEQTHNSGDMEHTDVIIYGTAIYMCLSKGNNSQIVSILVKSKTVKVSYIILEYITILTIMWQCLVAYVNREYL